MDRAFFKEYYHLERKHWWFRARLKILAGKVRRLNLQNPRILNIGAATGASSIMLSQFGEVTSVEYDHECCVLLNEELKLNAIEASITELPFADGSYDLVCAFDVVEHIENDALAVSELKRVCKKNGIVFCTVPTYQFLWSRHDEVNHHFRRYTRKSFIKLFGKDEKFVFRSYFNSVLFLPIAAFRILSRPFRSKNSTDNSGADNNVGGSGILNRLLYGIFRGESVFLNSGISFPFGVSFMCIWRKPGA